jgi:hypothetical protein
MMPDEPRPLHFVQRTVLIMEGDWPEVTTFRQDFLDSPYLYGATYDEQTRLLEFSVFNGGARYLVSDEAAPNGRRIATLVPDSARKTSRRP